MIIFRGPTEQEMAAAITSALKRHSEWQNEPIRVEHVFNQRAVVVTGPPREEIVKNPDATDAICRSYAKEETNALPTEVSSLYIKKTVVPKEERTIFRKYVRAFDRTTGEYMSTEVYHRYNETEQWTFSEIKKENDIQNLKKDQLRQSRR